MSGLDEIECFVKAGELKSLTAAANALKLPKFKIRSKIKNLEERELHDLPDAVVSSFRHSCRCAFVKPQKPHRQECLCYQKIQRAGSGCYFGHSWRKPRRAADRYPGRRGLQTRQRIENQAGRSQYRIPQGRRGEVRKRWRYSEWN